MSADDLPENEDELDAALTERFRALERTEPPETWPGVDRGHGRRWPLVVAAAAVVVLAVIGAVVLSSDDPRRLETVGAPDGAPSPSPTVPSTVPGETATTILHPGGGIDGPVMFAAPNPDGTAEEALIEGTLELDGDCLYVVAGADRYPVLWPHGTSWQEDPPGVVLPGGLTVSVGSGFVGAGGGYHSPGGLSSFVADRDALDRATQCAEPPYGEIAVMQSEPASVAESATVTDEKCRALVGPEPWLVLFERGVSETCVLVAHGQNVQVWNKGVDTLTVEWPGGTRTLSSDDFFETGPIEDVLEDGRNTVTADPYPIPAIRVMPPEQSPTHGLPISASSIGDATVGMTIEEASRALGVEVVVDPDLAPGPTCWRAVVVGDPYSPVLIVNGDGSPSSTITEIIPRDAGTAEPAC